MKKVLSHKHHHYHVLSITLFVAVISLVLASTSFIEPTEKIFFETSVTGQVITGMSMQDGVILPDMDEKTELGSPTDLLGGEPLGSPKPSLSDGDIAEPKGDVDTIQDGDTIITPPPAPLSFPEKDEGQSIEEVSLDEILKPLQEYDRRYDKYLQPQKEDIEPIQQPEEDIIPPQEEPGFFGKIWDWMTSWFSSSPSQTYQSKLPPVRIEPFEIDEGEEHCMLALPSNTISTTNTLTGASIRLTGREVDDALCLEKRQALIEALADLKGAIENNNQAVQALRDAESKLAASQEMYEKSGESTKTFLENKMLDAQDAVKEATTNYQQAKSDLESYRKPAQDTLDDFVKSGCDKDTDGDGATDAKELLQGTNPDVSDARCCFCAKTEGIGQTSPGQTMIPLKNIFGKADIPAGMSEQDAINACAQGCGQQAQRLLAQGQLTAGIQLTIQLTNPGTTCDKALEQLKQCPTPQQDQLPTPPTDTTPQDAQQQAPPTDNAPKQTWTAPSDKWKPMQRDKVIEQVAEQPQDGTQQAPTVSVQGQAQTPEQICSAMLKGSIPLGMQGNDVMCGCPEGKAPINNECTSDCNTICPSKGYTATKPDYEGYVLNFLQQYRCVKGATVNNPKTHLLGPCNCYEQATNPIINVDTTIPYCDDQNIMIQGANYPTPSGCRQVPCDQSKTCACPHKSNCILTISCRWRGWVKDSQGQITASFGPESMPQEGDAPPQATSGSTGGTGSQGGVVIPG